MKHLVSLISILLLFVTFNYAIAGDTLNIAVSRLESDISNNLKTIGVDLKSAAKDAGKLKESEIRKLLLGLYANRPYVIDASFINSKGIMTMIEPDKYRKHEGSDISDQEAVILMQKSKRPFMSNLLDSVEGIKSIDIEYPVFSADRKFVGSLSLLVEQDKLIRKIAAPVEKELNVNCFVMQKNGILIYDTDSSQIGLNTFSDQLYKDYPELVSLGKRMVREKDGTGYYTFLIRGTDKIIKKQAAWKTIRFFDNDWIVVAYREIK
ncbi:MAG: cache domain-containing protein [Proteobacteria bacterium]|nr:cache domain-containing protein [Pseudomonadota bacterium]